MHDEDPKPATVLQDAERLLGRVDTLADKTDDQIKRVVVTELLDIDLTDRSDSFVQGAYHVLATGNSAMPIARRELRLAAARRTAMQISYLRNARPAGVA
jgi:hypothetical protein